MEGPQGGRTPTCQEVRGLSEEQKRVESSYGISTTASHSRGEMGEHIHGFYHRVAHGAGQGLHLRHS